MKGMAPYPFTKSRRVRGKKRGLSEEFKSIFATYRALGD